MAQILPMINHRDETLECRDSGGRDGCSGRDSQPRVQAGRLLASVHDARKRRQSVPNPRVPVSMEGDDGQ